MTTVDEVGLPRVLRTSSFFQRHGVYSGIVVLQPTTFCNLDCKYCYLANRRAKQRMSPTVACRVSDSISEPTTVLWHSGEPLATGLDHFMQLVSPFLERSEWPIRHSIQTNATLLDDKWCDFLQANNFNIGVSIDGPKELSSERVYRSGEPAFERVLDGMQRLRKHGLPFAIIAVVREATSGSAREIYEFARQQGAQRLAINMEEVEGVHAGGGFRDVDLARRFWKELYKAWRDDPAIRVREFERLHTRFHRTVLGRRLPDRHSPELPQRENPLLPTVATNGDVTLFSPEFVGAGAQFVVGNVLREPLDVIVTRGMRASYVEDFGKALDACKEACPYYDFCGGSFPSNRFSEHGRIDIQETNHCKVHDQALVRAVLEELR